MKKDVLVSISGLHYSVMGEEGDSEPVEVITPGSYYFKNGKHYILYDEVIEGVPGTIKNTIKITENSLLEITKRGISNTQLVFEKGRINITDYETPYGDMLIGIHTKDIEVDVRDERIDVRVSYALDVNSEPLTDCEIKMNIKEV